MDAAEVAKIKSTIRKLEALAADNSGATENERNVAKDKIRQLKLKLGESVHDQAEESWRVSGSKTDFDWNDFFRGFVGEDEPTSRFSKEDFEKFKKSAQQERVKESRQAKEDLTDNAEEKSRAFLGGVNIKEIKFYQCESGLYIIGQMTREFLNQEIASLARIIAALEQEPFADLNEYKIRSAKLMKDRLKIERDSRDMNTDQRRWRFRG